MIYRVIIYMMNVTNWTLTIVTRVRSINNVDSSTIDFPLNFSGISSTDQSSQSITTLASNVTEHNYVIYILAITALMVALLTSTDIDLSSAFNRIRKILQWMKNRI